MKSLFNPNLMTSIDFQICCQFGLRFFPSNLKEDLYSPYNTRMRDAYYNWLVNLNT